MKKHNYYSVKRNQCYSLPAIFVTPTDHKVRVGLPKEVFLV